eukprot:s1861_g7.t2
MVCCILTCADTMQAGNGWCKRICAPPTTSDASLKCVRSRGNYMRFMDRIILDLQKVELSETWPPPSDMVEDIGLAGCGRGGMLWQIPLAAVLAVANARLLREGSNALRNLSAKGFQGDQDFASFALCCQAQRPSDSARCDLCGRQQWPCEQLLRQQRSTLDQLPSVGVADDVTTPGIAEMRAFFEHSVTLYLTGEITDPVFLDIEYVLPAIFLAVGRSKRSKKRSKFEFMDVGAYAGSVSCGALAIWDALKETISDWPGPGGRGVKLPEIHVTALEPSTNRCAMLQGKSAKGQDGCQGYQGQSRGRLDAHCVAASFENSEAVMQCPNGMSFLADDGSQANVVSEVPCGEPLVVKTVRLDEFTKDLGIHEVDVVKVDAEGYDYNVLLGASGLLESRRIRFVIFEACAIFSCPTTESQGQMEAAVRYFASMKYVCFMIAPEMLVPLTGDWLTVLYRFSQLTFNVLCAHQKEPLMKEIIQLYSRTPRATQFALASLQDPPPSYAAAAPRCGRSCLDPLLGDAALRQSAAQAEVFFEALHQRIVLRGWQLPHMRFVHARQLQAAGKVNLALPIYHELQATLGEPATFEAQKEYYKLLDSYVLRFLNDAGKITGRNGTQAPSPLVIGSLQELEWYHERPGSGVSFEQIHKCKALQWLLPVAEAGDAYASLHFAFITHFGLCSGQMTRQSLAEASWWYRRAQRQDSSNGLLGRWGLQAMELSKAALERLKPRRTASGSKTSCAPCHHGKLAQALMAKKKGQNKGLVLKTPKAEPKPKAKVKKVKKVQKKEKRKAQAKSKAAGNAPKNASKESPLKEDAGSSDEEISVDDVPEAEVSQYVESVKAFLL